MDSGHHSLCVSRFFLLLHHLHHLHRFYLCHQSFLPYHLLFLCLYPSLLRVQGPGLRSFAVSSVLVCTGVCVLYGCIVFHQRKGNRSCVDRLWSSQLVAQYRDWSVGQARVAIGWNRHVSIASHRIRVWLPFCSLLRRNRIWIGSVDAWASIWWTAATRNWTFACRPALVD